MASGNYGYDSYRGRSGGKTVLTALIVILLAALLLAIAFFFFAQPYITYGDDGKAHFQSPFSKPTPTPEPSRPAVIVVTPEPAPAPTSASLPGPVLVELPASALADGTARQQVEALEGDGAVFWMKAPTGILGYESDLAMAKVAEANPADRTGNEAITALNQSGLYTVARVSALRDNKFPFQYGLASCIRTTNGNWRDASGIRWLSPAKPRARDYVTGICLELCALGFDEIWLDRCAFPTPADGDMSRIVRDAAYNGDTLREDLEGFYAAVRSAVKEQYPDVVLSFTAEKGVLLSDPEDLSGQTAALLAQYADKVYLPGPQADEDYSAALEAMGFPQDRLVYLSGEDIPVSFGRLVTP